MADIRETHVWFDGEHWHLYTERRADLTRFTRWFGEPARRGRGNACAHWNGIEKDAVRIRRKARSSSKPPTESQVFVRQRFADARRAIRRISAPKP